MSLVVDPRFPGGTSSAVAAEVRTLAPAFDLELVGIESAMFRGRSVSPALREALDQTGLDILWNPPVVRADTIVVHNPASLKFDADLPVRLSCATAVVVTHENFLRPGAKESFDVGHCLMLLEAALVCGSRWLAPVSPINRRSVEGWLRQSRSDWKLAPFDWFNVCDMPLRPPVSAPRDRRGRHSRPGLEKFPPFQTLLKHFPSHAEYVGILGADQLLLEPDGVPAHWDLRRFGEMNVDSFLEKIDFFVYFTNPLWRESFGRAIAEAIAAGKAVITDPETAEAFGPAVVRSDGDDVDAIIADFVSTPARYTEFVASAQSWLTDRGPEAFRTQVRSGLARIAGQVDAVL